MLVLQPQDMAEPPPIQVVYALVDTQSLHLMHPLLSQISQLSSPPIGIIMSWHLTAHPFATRPSFLALADASYEEKRQALMDPAFRARLLAEKNIVIGDFETFITTSFHKMFPCGDTLDYEPSPKESIADIAARQGRSAEEVALDYLLSDDTNGFLYFPLFNYANGNLDVLHELHSHPRTMMGLSDAGAHCGAICDGGMPTFMLTHWTRDRTRGEKLPLGHVIRRQTMDTARFFELNDRGILAPGYRADINVIDYENLSLGRPEVVHDLPAGGRRLLQKATGYNATLVAGQTIAEHGTMTCSLPGKLLRGPQGSPAGQT